MTEYHIPYATVPPLKVQERKEARRKLLEMIWQRRREQYKRFMQKKRQLQTRSDLETSA